MLTLDNICKTFDPGTVSEKEVLKNFSLHLDRGEFVTLIGSNGAGKSTVFNAVSGSFFVDAGHILLDGRDITFEKDYRRAHSIGRLFQDPMQGTAPSMSVEENLALSYAIRERSRPSAFAPRKKNISETVSPRWGSALKTA